jgi:hypothetical protein
VRDESRLLEREPDSVQGLLFPERLVREDGRLTPKDGQCYDVPEYKPFKPEHRMYLTVFAVRPKDKAEMKFPTQQKYLRFPTLTKKAA